MPQEKLKISHWQAVWRFIWNPRTDWKPKAVLIVAVLYLISPLGLLIDAIPIFGWLSDIGLLSFVAWYLIHAAGQSMSSNEQLEQPIVRKRE